MCKYSELIKRYCAEGDDTSFSRISFVPVRQPTCGLWEHRHPSKPPHASGWFSLRTHGRQKGKEAGGT